MENKEIINGSFTVSKRLILADNPKPGQMVYSFDGGRKDRDIIEQVIIRKINQELFETNKLSCLHISNIYYSID